MSCEVVLVERAGGTICELICILISEMTIGDALFCRESRQDRSAGVSRDLRGL